MKKLFDDGGTSILPLEASSSAVVIDVSNLAHRCAHAYSLSTSNGTPSGHVYGSIIQILSLIKNKSTSLLFAVDGYPWWKHSLYPEYKAGRIKSLGFNPAKDVVQVLSLIPNTYILANDNEEADDTIASFVDQTDKNVTVVSSDKDLWQLYPKAQVYVPKRGKINNDDVYEEFGLPPDKIPLYKAVYGDASDNIKGVHRLTKKHVTPLINDSCGTVEGFLDVTRSSCLTKNTQKKIEDSIKRIENNFALTSLKKDLQFNVEKSKSVSIVDLQEKLQAFECTSLIERVKVFDL